MKFNRHTQFDSLRIIHYHIHKLSYYIAAYKVTTKFDRIQLYQIKFSKAINRSSLKGAKFNRILVEILYYYNCVDINTK